MGASFTAFCAHFCCCCCSGDDDDDEPEEKSPLLRYRNAKKRRDQETNLWSEPGDPSHSERDDDRELYNLLQKRSKTQRGSQGYRRLSVDINAMREVRRGVRDRWKLILEDLGFVAEAEALLTVSTSTSFDRMHNAPEARALLSILHTETSIFDSKEPPPERYMFTLDRLIYLDAAQDFVAKARSMYPKRDDDDDDDDEEDATLRLPFLLRRAHQAFPRDEEEEELDSDALDGAQDSGSDINNDDEDDGGVERSLD
uniref:Zgc:91968 n=1 Tax=Scleropages formosus TaxID=113540 RepID=A0A8C9RN73_SCLFO